jgi:glyoxylase-like metal-dependent hydrolase (beta-lactamase superfamily II)
MSKSVARAVYAVAGLSLLFAAQGVAAQQTPVREITQVSGDLYRFRNNFHYSVFLVTRDGVIVTDPINADAARWLKAEIARRFGAPIKYLVYSHDHADHIAGGEVFDDTAVVIAHENAKPQIVGEKRPTAVPEITFSDRMEIELGGKRVELIYLGLNHSDNTIVMRFAQERVLFAVDIVARNRLPYRDFPNAYIDQWIETLRRIEAMDFDVLAPGHGELGTKADVAAHRQYIETLRAQVLEHIRAGRSLDEIKRLVTMDAYRDWGSYAEWRELNVEGMYRYLQLARRPN